MKKLILFFSLLIVLSAYSQTWVPVDLNTTKHFHDVHFLDTDNGWIVGSEGAIFRYYNQTWHEMDAGTDIYFYAVFMVDTNDVWLAGAGGNIFHFTSSGFQPVPSPTTKSLNDIYMLSSQQGWIAGNDGTLLVYDGNSWQNEYIEPSLNNPNHLEYDDLLQIDFLGNDYGMIVGEWGTRIEYTNGWTDLTSVNTWSFVSVEIMDTNNIAIGGFENNPAIMSCFIFTFNPNRDYEYFAEGWSWDITSIKIIGEDGWAVIANGNILHCNSSDFEVFQDIDGTLNSLVFINDTTGWIVGNSGIVLKLVHCVNVDLGEDRSFCEGNAVVLYPGEFTSYFWSTGDTTQTIEVDQPGEYRVEVTDEFGATGSDTIVLTMHPIPGTPTVISGPVSLDSADHMVSYYTASELSGITEYVWKLEPVEAGIIYGNTSTSWVFWEKGFTGTAELSVMGKNLQCKGEYSAVYTVNVNSPLAINEYGSVTDIDGHIYLTVTIGTQVWMVQNLRATKFQNGDTLEKITDMLEWPFPYYGPAYCNYNNDEKSSYTYGRIYHADVVTDSRNICPVNWHIPGTQEWTDLYNYLGGENVAGGKLKEAGTSRWLYPNMTAPDQSGFLALPGGRVDIESGIYDYGYFTGLNELASFWAANASACPTLKHNTGIISNATSYPGGSSIRCLSDFPAGINDSKEMIHIDIVPNPTNGIFQVKGDNITGILVLNPCGQVIYKGKSNVVDLSKQPDGIYFLKITTDKGMVTKKVLKEK